MKLKDSDETFGDDFRDPEVFVPMLNGLLHDDDTRAFLSGLRDVAKAHGFASVAGAANVNRENLYRSLRGDKNPRIDTIQSVLKALGYRFAVVADVPDEFTETVDGPAEPVTRVKVAA
jgi:probable addiction module antidote protein